MNQLIASEILLGHAEELGFPVSPSSIKAWL